EKCFAFLDINPLTRGHVLVVPKIEEDYIFDLDEDTVAAMMVFARRVAIAIRKAVPCNRVGLAVLGMEVLHAHIHLVPLNRESDLDFKKAKLKITSEEMEKIASDIRQQL